MQVTPPHVLVHAATSGDFTMKVNFYVIFHLYMQCTLCLKTNDDEFFTYNSINCNKSVNVQIQF